MSFPSNSTNSHKTTLLIVLDGWGYREDPTHNAIAAAKTPFFNSIWNSCPHSLLEASGNAVGLPEGQMGNSEVGHTTIGAGTILDTDLVRIDKAALGGEFHTNAAMTALFDHVKKHDSTLHVMGLLSDGGVHSHQEHLHAFLQAANKAGLKRVAVHVFTDGRDTPPQSAAGYLKNLEAELEKIDGTGTRFFIASISGRYFAMDRDNNWDRMAKAEKAIFECSGNICTIKPSTHLETEYTCGTKDELLEPVVCTTPNGIGCAVNKHDGIFIFNFRADRVRMLGKRLMEKEDLFVASMTEYSPEFPFPIAFPKIEIETTLATEISKAGRTQAHIAETEKFPHATYFLNGGRNEPHDGEAHIMLASRKDVKTHDEAPEMRAEAIADKAIEEITKGTDFIFINFANPDMVGHTANVPAIITAIETVDTQLQRVIKALGAQNGRALIIADHGNAEVNIDETGAPHTAHTINLVPCILTGTSNSLKKYTLKNGGLSDVAPTILDLMNLSKPQAMTGSSLISS